MVEIDMLGLQIYRYEHTSWVGRCSCEERVSECPHWSKIIGEVKATHGADLVKAPFSWRISDVGLEEEFGIKRTLEMAWYKFHRLIRTIAYKNADGDAGPFTSTYRQWIENRDFVAETYAKNRNVKVVVDASKDPLQMRDILKYSIMRVKVLFLTRDVRGLVWSALRSKRLTLTEEAKDWSRLNGRILKLLDHVDNNDWLHVKYESICSDPDQELTRIHDFLGVERDTLSPDEEKAKRHTVCWQCGSFQRLEKCPRRFSLERESYQRTNSRKSRRWLAIFPKS